MLRLPTFFQNTQNLDATLRPVQFVPGVSFPAQSGPAVGAMSRTSAFCIANRDSTVGTYHGDDPYRVMAELIDQGSEGSSAGSDYGENCILLVNPGLPHFNVCHLFGGLTAPSVAPIVKAFGAKRTHALGGEMRHLWPTSLPERAAGFPLLNEVDNLLWLPCFTQASTPAHEITLSGTPEVQSQSSSPTFSMLHNNKFWFVQDFDLLLITVKRPATFASSTHAVIGGWFSS